MAREWRQRNPHGKRWRARRRRSFGITFHDKKRQNTTAFPERGFLLWDLRVGHPLRGITGVVRLGETGDGRPRAIEDDERREKAIKPDRRR